MSRSEHDVPIFRWCSLLQLVGWPPTDTARTSTGRWRAAAATRRRMAIVFRSRRATMRRVDGGLLEASLAQGLSGRSAFTPRTAGETHARLPCRPCQIPQIPPRSCGDPLAPTSPGNAGHVTSPCRQARSHLGLSINVHGPGLPLPDAALHVPGGVYGFLGACAFSSAITVPSSTCPRSPDVSRSVQLPRFERNCRTWS